MEDSRRSFIASLMAIGPVASISASLPEPEQVSKIEHGKQVVYVLEFELHMPEAHMVRIKDQWDKIFGPDAPKLMILSGGAKLKKFEL